MRYRILGPLEVRCGHDWRVITAPKWRALLASLLLHPGQVVSTDRLAAELWGDDPPAKATNLVSIYVLRLRRLLGDPHGRLLMTRAPGYLLLVEPGDLDAETFDRLVGDGRRALMDGDGERAAALLAEALSLWRGDALADVPPSPAVVAESGRLEEARVGALELRVEADLARGRGAEVVSELRRLVAAHPLREQLWGQLIRALSGAGRQAEALEAYARAREVIADELGVDPGANLQRLYQDILSGDAGSPRMGSAVTPAGNAGSARTGSAVTPAGDPGSAAARGVVTPAPPSAPAPDALDAGDSSDGGDARDTGPVPLAGWPYPAQLPADIADFTGRGSQVRYLRELLAGTAGSGEPGETRSAAVVISHVAGAGGLGKTTLAVHAAHQLRSRFPDGQLYVNLRGASDQPLQPGDVLARLLRDLGVDGARIPAAEEERAALYRTRLTGREVLLVLDDARDAAQVRSLLPGSATCAVLITSRRRLPDLAGSRLVGLDVLDRNDARALLRRIVGAERIDAEPAATAKVLSACAGLPLAIRIAGARLAARPGWSVAALAARLASERRRIDELKVGDLAVRASFEVSFTSLPRPAEREWPAGEAAAGQGPVEPARAFGLLGLWTGPDTGLPAAAALLGAREDPAADALDVLIDAHLLEQVTPDRYRFHDLLRVYAAERADAEPQPARAAAIRRVLTWYLHTAEAAATVISPNYGRVPLGDLDPECHPLSFATLDEALDWCDAERLNLVAATRLAAANDLHDLAWKLPAASMSFFYRRSHLADWTTTAETGLESAEKIGDRRAEAWMLNSLGMALGVQRLENSIGCLERAQVIRREIGDREGEARTANNIGHTYLVLGRLQPALIALQQSLSIQRKIGHRFNEGIALGNLGETLQAMGRPDGAVDYLRQALAIFRGIGEQPEVGGTLNDLAQAYLDLGRTEEAIHALREALEIHRAVGYRLDEALGLKRLGHAQLRIGQLAKAREAWAEACEIFDELGAHDRTAEVRSNLDALSRRLREFDAESGCSGHLIGKMPTVCQQPFPRWLTGPDTRGEGMGNPQPPDEQASAAEEEIDQLADPAEEEDGGGSGGATPDSHYSG